MAKRHWYTGLSGACKVPRSLLGWRYEISPSAFLDHYAVAPDRICTDCAKAARLALAAESAHKADTRSDSDRYAELRKLVEAVQRDSKLGTARAALDALLDWRHR